MKQFSFDRFLNVARWDTTINRPFYIRTALGLMAAYLFMVIANTFFLLCSLIGLNTGFAIGAEAIAISMLFVLYIAEILSMCYVFHNFRDRHSRLSELMLPATSREKILWHVAFYALMPLVVFLVSIPVADLLNAMVCSFLPGHVNSVTVAMWKVFTAFGELFPMIADHHSILLALLIMVLYFVLWAVFAIMINSWRYRYNMIYTWLLQQGINYAFLLVFGSIFQMLFSVYEVEDILDVIVRTNMHAVGWGIVAIETAIIVGLCYGTSRLYRRAQLTTKGNK